MYISEKSYSPFPYEVILILESHTGIAPASTGTALVLDRSNRQFFYCSEYKPFFLWLFFCASCAKRLILHKPNAANNVNLFILEIIVLFVMLLIHDSFYFFDSDRDAFLASETGAFRSNQNIVFQADASKIFEFSMASKFRKSVCIFSAFHLSINAGIK